MGRENGMDHHVHPRDGHRMVDDDPLSVLRGDHI